MIEQIYEPPTDTSWFQKELDAICKGRGIKLRIQWAPRLYIARTVDREGTQRDFAKYPILFGDFRDYIRGRYYCRVVDGKLTTIAYQKVSDPIIPPSVLITDIALPDVAKVNPSVHLFVIERKLPDEKARQIHEEKVRMSKANLGFNLFRDGFPSDGIWDWFADVSEHRGVTVAGVETSCCEMAGQHGVRCQGLYREPGQQDLEAVRKALREWEAMPNLEDKTPLIEQGARDWEQAIEKYEDEALTELLQEARECEGLDEIARARSRVVLGTNAPVHRTPY